jgi:hypothetical protein
MFNDSNITNQNFQQTQIQQPQQTINQFNQNSCIENKELSNQNTEYPNKQININNNAINNFPKQKANKLNK